MYNIKSIGGYIIQMDKIFKGLGASNHTDHEREKDDFYATDPIAIDELLKKETLNPNVWECACGQNHLTNRLEKYGYNVRRSDLYKRIDDPKLEIIDFLSNDNNKIFDGDIITNPPYNLSLEFTLKALSLVPEGHKVVMFLKLLWLESTKRYWELFKNNPPKKIYVFSKRVRCELGGGEVKGGSAVCYAWYIFEKSYKGLPTIDWINIGKEPKKEEARTVKLF